MSGTGEILPKKVFRHPLGLPGKSIKLEPQTTGRTTPDVSSSTSQQPWPTLRRERSPLGISIETDVASPAKSKPKQIFPALSTPERRGRPRSRAGELAASKSPAKELSPFDREVPIVLSNQNTPRFATLPKNDHASAKRGVGAPNNKTVEQSQTPIIVLNSPKSDKTLSGRMEEVPEAPRRPHPPSSVYTPAVPPSATSTPFTIKNKRFPRLRLSSIPPVPRLGMPFASIKTPISARTPPSSAGTEFEDSDIDSPRSLDEKSPGSASLRPNRASLDTVPATPRRSRGWWDVLLSPFGTKRMTFGNSPKERAYTTDPDAPELPALHNASPMGETRSRGLGDISQGSSPVTLNRAASVQSRVHGGEAAKYYDKSMYYGEEDHQRAIASPATQTSPAASTIASPLAKGVSDKSLRNELPTPKTPFHVVVPEPSPEPEYHSSKSSPSPAHIVPAGYSPRHTLDPSAAPSTEAYHSPQVDSPLSAHYVEHGHQPRSATPKPTNYFSGFSSGSPMHHSHDDHHDAGRSPGTPFDALSPGVVEVADARPIQSARSIHTRSYQPSPAVVAHDRRPDTQDFFSPETHHNAVFMDHSQPPPLPPPTHTRLPIADQYQTTEPHNNQPEIYSEKHVPFYVEAGRAGKQPESQPHQPAYVEKRFQFNDPHQQKKPSFISRVTSSKKNKLLIGAGVLLVAILLLTLILCLTLTQHHKDMPVAATWLNLTGFPAVPTGIATIAGPTVKSQSSCVTNTDMWTCALPREDQAAVAPNNPDQPNFRLEIRFTGKDKALTNSSSSPIKRGLSPAAAARSLIKRDAWSDLVTWADPAPPSNDEQTFLGNTTDNIAEPFAGESTSFTISFLPTTNPSNLNNSSTHENSKRDNSSFPDFPAPKMAPNNTIAPAALLPFPSNQPLKLYNRGKDSEHYGFYSYFDKSLFLKLSTQSGNTTDPANSPGGSSRDDANALCTWSQTRFLVQIWTKAASGSVTPAAAGNGTASATSFSGSGTFPLPVTVTVDRHGGDASKKAVYCYGLDQYQRVIRDQKGIVGEARSFGGSGINMADGPFEQANTKGFGGSDGGSGGCSCQWENFS